MVLLVNPWIHDFSAYDLWIKPLGLLYLASVLQENGFDLAYIDCLDNRFQIKEDGRAKFAKHPLPTPEPLRGIHRRYGRYGISVDDLRKRLGTLSRPENILVTSGMTYWYPGVQETIRELRSAFPESRIILGGIYATLMPDHARRFSGADIVISGQFENGIVGLLRKDDHGRSYKSLDEYPEPSWHLTGEKKYRILYTSRGCPYRCTFCASDILNAQKFVQRSIEGVYQEIEKYSYRDGIRHLVFYDDALFINHRRHLEPLLRRVIGEGLQVNFHTPNGLNAREIDQTLAELMYAANFRTIRLSLESVNPEIQRVQADRKINNELFKSAVQNLYRAGYREGDLECYLIMGLPAQKKQDIQASLTFVRELGVIARLATFSPIPGTVEAEAARKFLGSSFFEEPLLQNHSAFPLKNNEMAEEELEEVKQECIENNFRIRSKPGLQQV